MIQELIKGALLHSEHRTQTTLGDRSKYIGLSDVGKAFGCQRSAVLGKVLGEKILPSSSEVDQLNEKELTTAIERLRTLERGHEQEVGITNSLRALGKNFVQQLEITIEHEGTPISAHLDFTLFDEHQGQVTVLESKSNKEIPTTPYLSHVMQVQGQIGLLQRFYNEPVFSVRDEQGQFVVQDVTLPCVAQTLFGISLPETLLEKDCTGYIVAFSGDKMKTFKPMHSSSMMTDIVLKKASWIWKTVQKIKAEQVSTKELEYARGFYPLCDYCSFAQKCPKFKEADHALQFDSMLFQLHEAKEQEIEAKELQKQLKANLSKAYEGLAISNGEYVSSEFGRFRNYKMSRSSLNQDALIENLGKDHNIPEDQARQLIKNSSQSTSFTKFESKLFRSVV